MRNDFDLVVIGSGPAGEKGAAQAAYYNKSVAIVEQAPTPGGIAVSSAGIPTKTLRETVLYVSGFRQREVYKLGFALEPEIALERLMTREAEVISMMTRAVERNIARHGIEMIQGRAILGPDRTVHVSLNDGTERVLRARAILIATGSHPVLPAAVPFHDPDVYDQVTILKLDRIPGRLLVVGAGAVGCEYASIFAALGVEVTLMSPSPHLLRHLDTEICQMQAEIFNGMGIRLLLGTPFASLSRVAGQLEVAAATGQRLPAEIVLFLSGIALSLAIPAAPGALGTYEFVGTAIVVSLGYSAEQGLATILLMRVITVFPPALAGLVSLFVLHVRPGDIVHAAEAADEVAATEPAR